MCGSAVEQSHDKRLESFKLAIKTDAQFLDGNYFNATNRWTQISGGPLGKFWGTSQEWFRRQAWRELGLIWKLEGVYDFYFALMSSWDANDLLALAETWQANDVGDTEGFDGDYRAGGHFR